MKPSHILLRAAAVAALAISFGAGCNRPPQVTGENRRIIVSLVTAVSAQLRLAEDERRVDREGAGGGQALRRRVPEFLGDRVPGAGRRLEVRRDGRLCSPGGAGAHGRGPAQPGGAETQPPPFCCQDPSTIEAEEMNTEALRSFSTIRRPTHATSRDSWGCRPWPGERDHVRQAGDRPASRITTTSSTANASRRARPAPRFATRRSTIVSTSSRTVMPNIIAPPS